MPYAQSHHKIDGVYDKFSFFYHHHAECDEAKNDMKRARSFLAANCDTWSAANGPIIPFNHFRRCSLDENQNILSKIERPNMAHDQLHLYKYANVSPRQRIPIPITVRCQFSHRCRSLPTVERETQSIWFPYATCEFVSRSRCASFLISHIKSQK